jgi:hypothetical protein
VWLPATVDARLAPELAGNALERRDCFKWLGACSRV